MRGAAIPDEGSDGRSELNPFAILGGREGARIGQAFRRGFASTVFVAVQVVDEELLECVKVAVTHRRM